MSVKLSDVLQTQSALYRAVRGAIRAINLKLIGANHHLSEWPIERAGAIYALSVTIERADGSEAGECRFTIGMDGACYFDADDCPLAPCTAEQSECEALLADFVARRALQEKSTRAA